MDLNNDALPTVDQTKVKGENKEKIERMRYRKHKKEGSWLLYPEDQHKVSWDLFITMILMVSCVITPYNIAFASDNGQEPLGWSIVNYTIDILFAFDIFVIFNSCFYDDEFQIVEDRVIIAKSYAMSWLIIDVVSIIPFELIFKSG